MDARTILANVREVSARFAAERRERQQRRGLVAADFAQLREAGFPLAGVPVDQGGIWESVRRSTRPLCELLRTLAHGDSSVALVCAMHPTVLVFWLANSQVPAPFQAAWDAQRRRIFQTVHEGAWWGTITSEPGSGGDLAKTQSIVRPGPTDGVYRLSGQKSFGSGSGWTPMRRMGTPEDIANVCALLCSEEAGFVTGQTISVDGGSSLMNPDFPLPLQIPA